ncbi:hypothetical protein LGW15_09670, partial [Streptococcus mutans]|nr:hypothetical protein [Streptococcus mutans]
LNISRHTKKLKQQPQKLTLMKGKELIQLAENQKLFPQSFFWLHEPSLIHSYFEKFVLYLAITKYINNPWC